MAIYEHGRGTVLLMQPIKYHAGQIGDSTAEEAERLLDMAAGADVNESIRQGLDDVACGRTRPAQVAFDEIRRQYRIPRRNN